MPIELESHRIIESKIVRTDGGGSSTILFKDEKCKKAKPGQFIMIWIPKFGEIPMSLSFIDEKGYSGVTLRPFGLASTKLFEAKTGDKLPIRGPYGKPFTPVKGNVLLVGGGTGLSPLIPMSENLLNAGSKVTLIIAAKNSKELIFAKRARKLLNKNNSQVLFVTEDGSMGYKGLATDVAKPLIKKMDMIYTCGPELMMLNLFNMAKKSKIPIEASLERLMECAIGICGICSIGKYLVCKDGTVFNSNQLKELSSEFGRASRDSNGTKIFFK